MPAFEYVAIRPDGRQEKGVLEGDSARQIRGMLRDRGLVPMQVAEVRGSRASGGMLRRASGSLSITELTLFTRQLATLVRAGLPLDEALTAVAEQSEGRRVRRIALGVRAAISEGCSLADALGRFPGAFPPLMRATVEAGEHSGRLDEVLERLADYIEERQALRSKLLLAAIYPAILTLVAIGIVTALLTYVVPQVVSVFEGSGQQLPALTRGLIALSDFVRAHGLTLLGMLAAALVLLAAGMRRPTLRRRVHRMLLRLPVIGRLVRSVNTARFTRTLGILAGSGVPILDAMRIGSQVLTNLPMREAVEHAARKVREGSSLHRSLAESRLFPPITLHLIASGESSGKLDEMLDRAASNQEREVETMLSAMMGLLEPALILIMGGVVLMIVLAILLPIFDMNQLVR